MKRLLFLLTGFALVLALAPAAVVTADYMPAIPPGTGNFGVFDSLYTTDTRGYPNSGYHWDDPNTAADDRDIPGHFMKDAQGIHVASPLGTEGAAAALDFNWVWVGAVGDYVVWDMGRPINGVRVYPCQDHGPYPGTEFDEFDVLGSNDKLTWQPALQIALYYGDINNVRTHDGVKDYSFGLSSYRYIMVQTNTLNAGDFEIDALEEIGRPEAPEAAGRRSSRIAIAIPITLSGKDEAGNAFKEKSRTIVINKHGAKISTFHHLALGADVTVENQLLGRSAKATVVWFGDRRSPRAPMEIGIRLEEAQNLWGIELPPEDWQEGPPIGPGGQKLEKAFAQKARPSASLTAEGWPGAAARMPAAAGAPPAKLEKRAEAALEERVRVLEEHLARLSEQVAPGTSGSFPGSARHRGEEVLQSLDKRVDEVVGLFEAYRSDLGAFVARADEIRKASQEEAEKAHSRIQSAASEALDRGVGELREKIRWLKGMLQWEFERNAQEQLMDDHLDVLDLFREVEDA